MIEDDLRRRALVISLEKKRESLDAKRTALLQELTSALTVQDRREAAFKERDELLGQLVEFAKELKIETGK